MATFESYNQAQRQVADAERQSAYTSARLTELLPELREQERLKIILKSAQGRVQRSREADALARRIQERMRSRGGGERAEIPDYALDLPNREREYAAAAAALAAVRERIETRDLELRQRFGLPLDT